MTTNRANLALDEQSFQSLLAAAFTIQEHNDRANSDQPFPDEQDHPPLKTEPPEPPKTCSQCGAALATDAASCPNCDGAGLRPGERLQRNWASMWLMSQDLHLSPKAVEEGETDPRSTVRNPGHPPVDPHDVVRFVPTISAHSEPAQPRTPRSVKDDAPSLEHTYADPAVTESESGLALSPGESLAAWPVEAPLTAVSADSEYAVALSADSEDLTGETEPVSLVHEPSFSSDSSELDPGSSDSAVRRLRVKLRFRRADLYLGLAVLVAAVALLWPTGPSRDPKLPPWERILIAMGIAEEPQPVVHYHGDPDLKVWVDTHTALYYCPGDELYGKSPDGHYSTQRDAQSDRFEPAERSVCIQ
jgi:ribosomal protein L40E